MNFKDTLVYLILGLIILASAVSYILLVLNKPNAGDNVVVPASEGFYQFEMTNWNAVAGKNASTVYVEFFSKFMTPLRVKVIDNGKWAVRILRKGKECNIRNITVSANNMLVQVEDYTQFISGTDKLQIEIATSGPECTGIQGQGYKLDLLFEVEQHNGRERQESGTIKGFFS